MPIGGAERKTGHRTILSQFVQLSGGSAANIVIIPTASAYGVEVGAAYTQQFNDLGAACATSLNILSRAEADSQESAALIEQATGVFMSGGDQVKLVALLGGSRVGNAIFNGNRERGLVVGGTSAGASALSRHMIAFGRSASRPSLRSVNLAPGLGLCESAIIDQHFRERDRVGRLTTAVAHNPSLVGIGVDEDTALIIDADDEAQVIGSGTVTIIDGAHLQYTDLYFVKQHQPISVVGMTTHILTSGCIFNLQTRVVTPPPPPLVPPY